jgi:hypothetical protein
MIKQSTLLEVKKNERTYSLCMDPLSPLGEIYDVIHEMKQFIFQKIKDVESSQEIPQEPKPE